MRGGLRGTPKRRGGWKGTRLSHSCPPLQGSHHTGSACRGTSSSSPRFPPPAPRELLHDTRASSSWGREVGEIPACCEGGRAGSLLGCRAVGTCTRHPCQELLPGACAGYCTHASSLPTFLRIRREWQRLSAGWLWPY